MPQCNKVEKQKEYKYKKIVVLNFIFYTRKQRHSQFIWGSLVIWGKLPQTHIRILPQITGWRHSLVKVSISDLKMSCISSYELKGKRFVPTLDDDTS